MPSPLQHVERSGLRFEVEDAGAPDGPAVLLLHGFPGGAATWRSVVPALHAAGLRTLVPAQRGYSPGARPSGAGHYVLAELVADALAVADAAGVGPVHVVGHDWGGAVAWALGARHPERVRSLTVVSTPHPGALVGSLARSLQGLRSAYVAAFQVPALPEAVLLARGGAVLARLLHGSGLSESHVAAYVAAMREPGALAGALAWYRALPRQPFAWDWVGRVDVPTRYVWSSGDPALGRVAAEATGRFVDGPYRFEVLEGLPHWLPENHPDLVAEHVLGSLHDAGRGAPAHT